MTGSSDVVGALCDDLLAERRELLDALSPSTVAWDEPTPAPGWAVIDQITHLAHFDDMAQLAIVDPAAFSSARAGVDVAAMVEAVRVRHHDLDGARAWTWLDTSGRSLVDAARLAPPTSRVPWYGPAMSLASAVSARLMETWAHGQDIADALGWHREPSARLHAIAHLAVRAFPNSFVTHGLDVPDRPVAVRLGAPDGSVWQFGPADADDTIEGTALDFCLVATQRRHRDDTSLVARGSVADTWLDIAQAFAGPPGAGREPLGARR